MSVPVVNVRIMRVMVKRSIMHVWVTVSLMVVDQIVMIVPVMLVMHMVVIVFKAIVTVPVFVTLGKVQPNSNTHENGAGEEIGGDSLAENQNRK